MGTCFKLGKVKAAKERGMGSAFHWLCPRYSGTLTPTAPMAIKLWETFIFTFLPFLLAFHHRDLSQYFIFCIFYNISDYTIVHSEIICKQMKQELLLQVPVDLTTLGLEANRSN